MYKAVTIVEVRAWNHLVGAVALDPRLGYYAFEYAPAFIKTGIELAPLTMPLAEARRPFIFLGRLCQSSCNASRSDRRAGAL